MFWKNLPLQMIKELAKNLPLQENGRYSTDVFCSPRANKSMRLFEYIVDCLANEKQPGIEEIKKSGYLVRTTVVFCNGKFGMAPISMRLQNTDFRELVSCPNAHCLDSENFYD